MKIGYVCKYTPVEILESMGFETELIEPEEISFSVSERKLHPNMCSYVKGVCEKVSRNDYDVIVLTTCCDSMRRLYDILKRDYSDRLIYRLDLPRKINKRTETLYAERIEEFLKAIEEYSGIVFDRENFFGNTPKEIENLEKNEEPISIGIMGARPGITKEYIESLNIDIAFDTTCTGIGRKEVQGKSFEDMGQYAEVLMSQFPCKRMDSGGKREKLLKDMADRVDGVIYHSVKFCDMYSYEFARLRKYIDKPVLYIETDLTRQSAGQLKTRIEAFFESLKSSEEKSCPYRDVCGGERVFEYRQKLKTDATNEIKEGGSDFVDRLNGRKKVVKTVIKSNRKKHGLGKLAEHFSYRNNPEDRMKQLVKEKEEGDIKSSKKAVAFKDVEKKPGDIFVMGIDSGSTSTNTVILNGNGEIVSYCVLRTGAKAQDSAEAAYKSAVKIAGLEISDLDFIISTGYGRDNISFADRAVTEISCHGRGARYFYPEVRTILDIGGQDSKAIKIGENGEIIDFVMNDKCAAGTGRFLEAIAGALEMKVDELAAASERSKEKIDITSMCTVFAESEVISLIAANTEVEDIAAGVSRSIAGKALSLMKRVEMEEPYMMTGGVAKNSGVVKALSEMSGSDFYICEEPELAGAVGAALYALDDVLERK